MKQKNSHIVLFFCLILCFVGLGNNDKQPVSSGCNTDELFTFVKTTASSDEITVRWSMQYDCYNIFKDEVNNLFIQYKLKDAVADKWERIENIPLSLTEYTIQGVRHNENYLIQVGFTKEDQTVLSEIHPVHTKLPWGLFYFIVLIGSLGLFVYGMKVMSEGLQQALGAKIRYHIRSIGKNQLKGTFVGFSISAILQSIIVSVVMIVSFANAGLISLTHSTWLMLGANIGTIVTTWFINLLAFEFDLSVYALFILAFIAPLLFFGRKHWKSWINTFFGFVFLIMGLSFMIINMPENVEDVPYLMNIIHFFETPFIGNLLLVVVGIFFSLFLQSTVATIAFTMVMVYCGIISFEFAAPIVLGSSVGTAFNVEIASWAGNVHAKRSARIYTLISATGLVWGILALPLLIRLTQSLMLRFNLGDPVAQSADFGNTGIAIFHTLFYGINFILFSFLVPQLVGLSERLVKSKGRSDEVHHLEYIGTGLLNTADLSILEVKKEIEKFGKLIQRMSGMTRSLLFEQNPRTFYRTMQRIKKYEDITDRIEIEVITYLKNLSEGDLTYQTASRIHEMNSMVNDMERIGDIFYQMSLTIERKVDEKLWFTPEQRNNLVALFDLVDNALLIMSENLSEHQDKVTIDKAVLAESKINDMRDELRKDYLESLSQPDYNYKSGMIYSDLFASLEKVGDHIINVSEAVVGKV